MLTKMRACRRDFDKAKYMSSLIKNDEFLEKYYEIWDRVSNSITNGFDSEPVYNEKYLGTKIQFYERKLITNFHGDKVPKEGSQCICLSVILIDSTFTTGKNYYPQVFLEEYQYVGKEKTTPKYVTDSGEISSEEENSAEKNSDKGNSDEENYSEE